MYHTHTLAEWLAFLSLGVAGWASPSVPYFLLVDADLADFDPRPAVSRAVESGRVDWLLITVANARLDARHAAAVLPLHALQARDRARLALVNAVVAVLLRLNAPKGSAR